MGRYAFPVVSNLLHHYGGTFADGAQRDRMLFWCIHSALWVRFAGSIETVLTQDYETLNRDGTDGLINNLTRWRGGKPHHRRTGIRRVRTRLPLLPAALSAHPGP